MKITATEGEIIKNIAKKVDEAQAFQAEVAKDPNSAVGRLIKQKREEEKLPSEMTYEKLLEMRFQANTTMEELEAAIKVVNEELLIRLRAEKSSGKVVGNWAISKVVRYSFDTSLDDARALGAIKESVDSSKLKILTQKGIKIPGTKRSEYVLVREVEKPEVGKGGK